MLQRSIDGSGADEAGLAREISAEDDVVDRLNEAIKRYLTSLSQRGLDAEESARSVETLTFTTNLEHIGDIIDNNLLELADKKIRHRLRFSPEGWAEIRGLHRQVTGNLRLDRKSTRLNSSH